MILDSRQHVCKINVCFIKPAYATACTVLICSDAVAKRGNLGTSLTLQRRLLGAPRCGPGLQHSASDEVLRRSACMLECTASFHPQCALLCMPLCPAIGSSSMQCLCRRSCCGCLQKQWPTERYRELVLLASYLWQNAEGRFQAKLSCAWHHVSSRRGIALCRLCQSESRQGAKPVCLARALHHQSMKRRGARGTGSSTSRQLLC